VPEKKAFAKGGAPHCGKEEKGAFLGQHVNKCCSGKKSYFATGRVKKGNEKKGNR